MFSEPISVNTDMGSMTTAELQTLYWKPPLDLRATVKPVLRDHCHERPPVLKDHTFLAEGPTFQHS